MNQLFLHFANYKHLLYIFIDMIDIYDFLLDKVNCVCLLCVSVSECVVLHGIFKLGKKSHDVLLTRTKLTWTPIIPENPTGQCPW